MARKGSARIWRVVFIVALVALIVSLGSLGTIAFSYHQGQEKYQKVADTAFEPEQSGGLAAMTVDWDALLELNADTVGWVYVPNSPINYPIVQAEDNSYYLTRDFSEEEGWLANYGAIFLDYSNDPEFGDAASFVYGHHMNDGSMFAYVGDMDEQAEFDNARDVYILTPKQNYKLRSFSLVHCNATEEIVETTFESPEAMESYVDDMKGRSKFDAGQVSPSDEMDKLFALATCDSTFNSSGRNVLFCYIIETAEPNGSGQSDFDSIVFSERPGDVHDERG